jgi:hypothetical protein
MHHLSSLVFGICDLHPLRQLLRHLLVQDLPYGQCNDDLAGLAEETVDLSQGVGGVVEGLTARRGMTVWPPFSRYTAFTQSRPLPRSRLKSAYALQSRRMLPL